MADSAFAVQSGGSHYLHYPIQLFEFCFKNKIPKAESDCIYYLCRWRSKNGIADLKKARHTLDMLIELAEKEEVDNQPTDEELLRAGHSPKEWRASSIDSPYG